MSTQTKREAFERGLEKANENPSIIEIFEDTLVKRSGLDCFDMFIVNTEGSPKSDESESLKNAGAT